MPQIGLHRDFPPRSVLCCYRTSHLAAEDTPADNTCPAVVVDNRRQAVGSHRVVVDSHMEVVEAHNRTGEDRSSAPDIRLVG